MNKKSQKKVTKHKGSKIKTDNDAAEVFVLPPNLLEQLGINLTNIGSAPESTKDSLVTDINIHSKEKVGSMNRHTPIKHSQNNASATVEKQSSITETAELMKKSVFLSPTFISNNINVIQGEIEIIGNAERDKLNEEVIFDLTNFEHCKFKNPEEVQESSETVSGENELNSTAISLPAQGNKEWDVAVTTSVEIQDIEMQTLVDDHADEAYSSDCSNSNIGCSVTTNFKNSKPNKINIISEQIILPSQYSKLGGDYSSQENKLVHVSKDTLIKSHQKGIVHRPKCLNKDVIPNIFSNKPPTEPTVNECTFMYEEHCVNEIINISTLNSETLQTVDKIDPSVELSETVSDFIITPYDQENLRQDNLMFPKTDTFIKDNATVNTGMTISWHVDTVDINTFVDKGTNEVKNVTNTETHNEQNKDEGIATSKHMITYACLDGNEGLSSMRNISVYENESKTVEDDITILSYVENDSIKNPSLENVILNMSQTSEAISQDNVTVDTCITVPWNVETDDVSKIKNTRDKEVGNGMNLQTCNKYIKDEGIETAKVLATDSFVVANEGVTSIPNSMFLESKSEKAEDDIPIISFVSDVVNETENIKNFSFGNVINPMSQKPCAIKKNKVKVGTDITIPGHVDTNDASKLMNNRGDEVTYIERFNEHNGDLKETTTKSDRNEEVTSMLSIPSHRNKSEIVEDGVSVISYVNKVEDEKHIKKLSLEKIDLLSTGDLKSPVESNIYSKSFKPSPNNNELETIQPKNNEQLTATQNGTFSQTDSSFKNTQHTLNEDISPCKDNCEKRSRDISRMKRPKQCKRDKKTHAIAPILETSTQNSILETDSWIKQECRKQEFDDLKNIPECSESNVKRNLKENGYCGSYNVKGDHLNKDSIILDDKIREIAQYLSKFADLKKRSNINAKQKMNTKIFSNKKHDNYSKSSIYGVEKPGGSGIYKKHNIKYPPINTYERKHKQSCKPAPSHAFKAPDTSAQSINLVEMSSSSDTSNEMEFCLCHDFGRLLYYDNESSYGHIHFWNNTVTDCTLDVIFSIFNEDTSAVTLDNSIQCNKDKNEYISEESVTSGRKLCWNEIKFLDHSKLDDDYDLDLNVKRKEENYYQVRDEDITSKVNWENKCNESEEINNETKCSKSKVSTVNLLQNGKITPNTKMVADERSEKTGKKRKCSIIPSNNEEPPVKKYGSISKQGPQIKKETNCSNKSRTATNMKITATIEDNCAQGSSTPYHRMVTNSVEEQSASMNKAARIELQPSFFSVDDVITNPTPKSTVEPSKTVEATTISTGQPKIPSNVAASFSTNQLQMSVNVNGTIICGESSTDVVSEVKHESHFDKNEQKPGYSELIKCGVCEESMQNLDWNDHIASRHNYLAWKLDEPSLDLNDEEVVREHLYQITKANDGLTCAKCGITRKYVKAYLSHIRSCSGLSESQNDSTYHNVATEATPEKKSTSHNYAVPANTDIVRCGVCEERIQMEDWNDHRASRHDYLAWIKGDSPLDVKDDAAIRQHLYVISKTYGELMCAKCGLTRKHVKPYLNHIKSCNGLSVSQNDRTYNISTGDAPTMESVELPNNSITDRTDEEQKAPCINTKLVECGVCKDILKDKDWYNHIASQHDYMAWKLGEPDLDVNNEEAVKNHLYDITKACGGLTCSKCGVTRKYVKSYRSHFKNCDGLNQVNDSPASVDARLESSKNVEQVTRAMGPELVKCGVCGQYMEGSDWARHLASNHEYLAWRDGETPLNVNDEKETCLHLQNLIKEIGVLSCPKCGLRRKYVKTYLQHIKNCGSEQEENNDDSHHEKLKKSQSTEASSFKCGVCNQIVDSVLWAKHLSEEHNYLAWKDGDNPLDLNNEDEVYRHLSGYAIEFRSLLCKYCGKTRKNAKGFLDHLKTCNQDASQNVESVTMDASNSTLDLDESVVDMSSAGICAVCHKEVKPGQWIQHTQTEHNYLAWREGEKPLNVNDEEETRVHLQNLIKEIGALSCPKCGLRRKYVKSYLHHMRICGDEQDISQNSEAAAINASSSTLELDDSVVDVSSAGTCAVCHKEVEAGQWIQHTQKEHNYLAWREGEKPWDLDDYDDVNQYLYVISKKMDGLTCNKCGLVRKYVKTFLTHIKNCKATGLTHLPTVSEGAEPVITNQDMYQCAMCNELIKAAKWNTHAMEKHYNVTWIVGQTPIDIKNPYVVERYIKGYKQVHGNLKCRTCGATRASNSGFYAHVITCGKTEEEIDMYKEVCDICNGKYLCIYRNQHAMAHKVQSYTAELKLKKEALKKEGDAPLDISGKRRAAVKARSVIETYSNNMSKHLHTCQSCGFGTDFKEELKKHKCQVSNEKDFSGDESSAAEIGSSDDESPDSDVDSNISNEVNDENQDDDEDDDEPQGPKKKIRYREPAPILSKVSRIPFEVGDPTSYIKQGDVEFCNTHLSDDVLFPLWRREPETVPELELPRYLPPMEQSCQLKSSSGWTTLDRFASKKDANGTSIFVGASIVCVAWAPPRVEHIQGAESSFLAIACHNGADCPRYQGDETPTHENMIQIWNFSMFKVLPEMSLGIAHEFGTVWSMAWCPSGARDPTPQDAGQPAARLGLLAAACSSGSAYIFAVPYPPTDVKSNPLIHKSKPLVELRMTTSSDRKRYQATSVSWSKQKGHNIVLVGYADGSTAYYDLHSTSPLLCTMENDVQVIYPYHDERAHNTCITGTDLYPTAGLGAGAGAGAGTCASAAPTGACMRARAGAGGAGGRATLHVAALGITFAPHAASAVLVGDDAIMHTTRSELVWVGGGRRLGSVRAAAGCARCGRVAASMPPTLRVLRPHPAYPDPRKVVVGTLEMTHLAKKRKQVNDELAMTVEPLTYDEAVSKYGIEFRKVSKIDRSTQQQYAAMPKSHYPERFPLADVKSLAFCPSRKYHGRLAVATHSGILFLITLD